MSKTTIFVDAEYLIAVTRRKNKRVDLVKLSKPLQKIRGRRRYFIVRYQSSEPRDIQMRKDFTARSPTGQV